VLFVRNRLRRYFHPDRIRYYAVPRSATASRRGGTPRPPSRGSSSTRTTSPTSSSRAASRRSSARSSRSTSSSRWSTCTCRSPDDREVL